MSNRVRTMRWVAAAFAFIAVATAGTLAWRWYRLPVRVEAALPARPSNLPSKSAELEKRINEAGRLARERRSALEGVAVLGRLYHANGCLREAESCWRLLRSEQPRIARWSYYLADLRRTAGDDAAVAELLAETARLAPDYAPSWLRLADLEFKTGRPDDADVHYRRRLALLPSDPYARLGLARVAMQRGDDAGARLWIEQIIQDTPDFPTAHNLYAEMLATDGRSDEAFRHRNLGREAGRFREADDPWMKELDEWCLEPKRLALLSTMAYQTRSGDRGVSLLERAVELAPDDPSIHEALGTLYLQLGEPAKAQPIFESTLRLPESDGRRVMLTVKLADALRLQQHSEDALRIVREELSHTSSAYELHNQHGAVLADLGRVEESVEAYRKAVALAPNDTDSNFNLGSGLLALGRREEGVRHLKQSLTLQPTYPRTLIVLGRMALEEGKLEEAYRRLKPLYDSNPDQAMARQLLAQYHLRVGEAASSRSDLAAAEKHYREGLKIDPDQADINASLGVLCLLQGRMNDALAPFEAYHRLRPEEPQSSLFLGQLYAQLGRFAEARRILTMGRDLAERAGNRVTAEHCREILEHLPPAESIPPRR
ncbi:MAG TPA: tetratricopeptide repeat protein [Opitutaceae bacterium]